MCWLNLLRVLHLFLCLKGMMATQKERRTISLEQELNILKGADKHVWTRISWVRQLGLLVSTLNMTVKNHVTEENANQCGRYKIVL
jgi:hypothetical protein